MSLFKSLLSHQSRFVLKPKTTTHKFYSLYALFRRTPSPSIQPENQCEPKPRKPLDILFKEAVEIYPKQESPESEGEEEANEVKRNLKDLEKEVRSLRANSNGENNGEEREFENSEQKGLYAVFTNRKKSFNKRNMEENRENPTVFKKLSPDMELFVGYLYREGYFKDANFLPRNSDGSDSLDFDCFEDSYGRGFIKTASKEFGKDKQEIAKWLSGSDLKKVALFGCPSLTRKSIFAAKRLRKFFEIQEDTVCSKCVLKQSCKFANQNVWKNDIKKLVLIDVLSVITLYSLESVPPELVVPDEIKVSVSRLLNEVIKLSQTTSSDSTPIVPDK